MGSRLIRLLESDLWNYLSDFGMDFLGNFSEDFFSALWLFQIEIFNINEIFCSNGKDMTD